MRYKHYPGFLKLSSDASYIADWIPYGVPFSTPCVGDDDWGAGLWTNLYKKNGQRQRDNRKPIESISSCGFFVPLCLFVFADHRADEPVGKKWSSFPIRSTQQPNEIIKAKITLRFLLYI